MNTFEILSELTSASGVSGSEGEACEATADVIKRIGCCAEISECSGTLFCKAEHFDENKPTILLDAHIDEIGMIVTYITDDGFLKVSGCGGLDNRVLLAQQVTVLGKERLTGIITSTPPHLEKDNSSVPETADVFIDIGMTKEQAEKTVCFGDRVLIENSLEKLQGSRVTSKALDNRAGVAAVIRALEMLKGKSCPYNIAAMFSSQEEVGERGAATGAFSVSADMAIVVDVSFAKTHSESDEDCGRLGKGPMIGIAPSLSRKMSDDMIRIAEENNIPYQQEIMSGKTGTDADVIGISQSGVMTVTVSVPEKHMHTPVEIIDMDDIENTAKLIAAFIENAR
ncbi:MAG: M20/M25/M40 family metallo-hydrolase [Oscillospiraceae bacterium]